MECVKASDLRGVQMVRMKTPGLRSSHVFICHMPMARTGGRSRFASKHSSDSEPLGAFASRCLVFRTGLPDCPEWPKEPSFFFWRSRRQVGSVKLFAEIASCCVSFSFVGDGCVGALHGLGRPRPKQRHVDTAEDRAVRESRDIGHIKTRFRGVKADDSDDCKSLHN